MLTRKNITKPIIGFSLIAICFFATAISPGCHKNSATPPPDTIPSTTFAKGADISWVSEMESAGRKFYTSAGVEQDCMDVLKTKGINAIRLRVWVNPADGWNGKADVVAKATRAKNKGQKIMIDFHYSDTWADPGHQTKPAAWAGYSLSQLQAAVYDHTFDVLQTLKNNGVVPTWVQTGNEINDGLLWPTGQLSVSGASNYASLVNSAYSAVKAVDTSIKTILHISNGFDNALFRWNLDSLQSKGGKWDITGMSSYPSASGWQAHNTQVLANMKDMITRYGKPVMIAEVGMDVNEPQATKDMLTDLINKTKSLGKNGLGVFYWEPEAYNWQGYTLVAFDNAGKPTIAMDAFLQ